jgi:hypothetical protein
MTLRSSGHAAWDPTWGSATSATVTRDAGGSMRTMVKRSGTAVVAAVIGLMTMAGGAAGLMTECANFVTTGMYDDPVTGWLIGSRTVTQTSTRTFSVGGSLNNLTGTTQYTQTTSTTYSIGTYQLSNGLRADLRCDTYRYATSD